VKIRLKQEREKEGIVVEALLDSGATGLVMSEEFARKHRFRRMKLEKPVYILENRRSTDNKMYRGMWKEVENRKAKDGRMAKTRSEREEKRF